MKDFLHKHLIRGRILLILLAASFVPGFSQDFVHFTQDNGLPSNKVYMMTIDANGFIWCATDKGIAMYNGDRFTTYSVQNGLPINDLWKIYATRDGKIWFFGRSNRLGYIENGKVFVFPTDDQIVMNPTHFNFFDGKVGFLHGETTYFLENDQWSGKRLSISDGKKLRQYFDAKNGKFLYGDIENHVILIVSKDSLFHYNENFELIYGGRIEGTNLTIRNSPAGIFENNEMFYFYITDRFCIYNYKKHTLKTILLKKFFTKENIDGMYLFYEADNLIINGPAGKYMCKNDSLIQTIKPVQVPGDDIKGFFQDSLGNIWINTFNNGIYMYPFYNNVSTQFLGENVQHIETYKGLLYAGVENKGLYEITEENETLIDAQWKYFYDINNERDGLKVINEGGPGYLVDDKFVSMNLPDTYYSIQYGISIWYPLITAKCIYTDSLLQCFATSSVLFVKTNQKNVTLVYTGIYQMVKYHGQLVLGTTTGIKFLGKDRILDINPNGPAINKLLVFHDYLLIGTDGKGLYTYSDTLTHITGTENLSINNIVTTSDTSFWISTSLGVHEIIYKEDTFEMKRSVLRSNGLVSNIVNDLIVSNDSLFCATENGLCVLGLKGLKLDNKPKILFTRKDINDSLFVGSDTMVTRSNGRNALNVSFDIAYLNEHSQLKSYYKVDPLNKEWLPLNTSGFTINGLQPGNYTIAIKTEGLNGNKDEKSFVLIITPRWFETTWFYIVTIVILLLLLGMAVSFIVVSITRRRNKKFRLENQMINLELQALRSKLNPHFIFNTFNAIQLYINSNQVELSEKYLILLSKHIRNVFEFSHLQKIPLEKEISLLKDYLEIEKTRFGDKIDIKISVDENLNLSNQQIPSMIIQPYVENSMVHGLFHKEGVGHLQVEFIYINQSTYQVRIIDDGIGFIQSESERISSTKVNKDRIDLINQSGDFYITMDKSFFDETKKDKGTVITITISDGK